MNKIVTRFAPSPTGLLHVGGVRTALFAWLIAKQNKGTFILRIEDTDKNREVEGSIKHIQDSLSWLGINWDEGVGKGGENGPYLQSERLEIYKEWANKLIESGRAYADPYTQEELNNFRETAKKNKQPFLFRNHRPENPPKWDGSHPLRFKSIPKKYSWTDEVMGELSSGPEAIDDFILIKSDGYPTYNFAHIIDDYLMQCSHVIRSQEFIASVPKYLNLYEALEITPPKLATVPFVMGPDGKKKLSKRDGAKDVLDYKKEGFLPDALLNFIATLGWNDGTEQEIFSVDELIQKFNLSRVQKSGAKFDEQRLIWINGSHIRNMNLDDLYIKSIDFWTVESNSFDDTYKKQVLSVIQERLKFFKEIPELTTFFFNEPKLDDVKTLLQDQKNKQLKKLEDHEKKEILIASKEVLVNNDFSLNNLETDLNNLLTKLDTKPGILFSLIRIAITGAPFSPGLFDTLHVLGKDRSIARIEKSIQILS